MIEGHGRYRYSLTGNGPTSSSSLPEFDHGDGGARTAEVAAILSSSAASSSEDVLTAVGRKRNNDWHDLFPSIPKDEILLEGWTVFLSVHIENLSEYACAWQKEVLIQGKMYISENRICFNANIFGWTHSLNLALDDLANVQKKSVGGLIPNSIEISMISGATYFFASFLSRDATYDMITKVWGGPSKSIHMQTFQTNSSNDDLRSIPEHPAEVSENDDYVSPTATESDIVKTVSADMTRLKQNGQDQQPVRPAEPHRRTDQQQPVPEAQQLPPLPEQKSLKKPSREAEPESVPQSPQSLARSIMGSATELDVLTPSAQPTFAFTKLDTTVSDSGDSYFTPRSPQRDDLPKEKSSPLDLPTLLPTERRLSSNVPIKGLADLAESLPGSPATSEDGSPAAAAANQRHIVQQRHPVNLSQLHLSARSRSQQSSPERPVAGIPRRLSLNAIGPAAFQSKERLEESPIDDPLRKPAIYEALKGANGAANEMHEEGAAVNTPPLSKRRKVKRKKLVQKSSTSNLSTAGPTTCPCEAERAKRIVVHDATYPLDLAALFNLMYSKTFLEEFLATRKCTDINVGAWDDGAESTDESKLSVGSKRKMEYVMALSNPLGPKSTRCIGNERVVVQGPSGICLEQDSTTPDVPAGNTFTTHQRVCFTRGAGGVTKLWVGCEVEFHKSTVLKTAVPDGMKAYFKELDPFLRKYIETHPELSKAPANGAVKEMVEEEEEFTEEEVEDDTADRRKLSLTGTEVSQPFSEEHGGVSKEEAKRGRKERKEGMMGILLDKGAEKNVKRDMKEHVPTYEEFGRALHVVFLFINARLGRWVIGGAAVMAISWLVLVSFSTLLLLKTYMGETPLTHDELRRIVLIEMARRDDSRVSTDGGQKSAIGHRKYANPASSILAPPHTACHKARGTDCGMTGPIPFSWPPTWEEIPFGSDFSSRSEAIDALKAADEAEGAEPEWIGSFTNWVDNLEDAVLLNPNFIAMSAARSGTGADGPNDLAADAFPESSLRSMPDSGFYEDIIFEGAWRNDDGVQLDDLTGSLKAVNLNAGMDGADYGSATKPRSPTRRGKRAGKNRRVDDYVYQPTVPPSVSNFNPSAPQFEPGKTDDNVVRSGRAIPSPLVTSPQIPIQQQLQQSHFEASNYRHRFAKRGHFRGSTHFGNRSRHFLHPVYKTGIFTDLQPASQQQVPRVVNPPAAVVENVHGGLVGKPQLESKAPGENTLKVEVGGQPNVSSPRPPLATVKALARECVAAGAAESTPSLPSPAVPATPHPLKEEAPAAQPATPATSSWADLVRRTPGTDTSHGAQGVSASPATAAARKDSFKGKPVVSSPASGTAGSTMAGGMVGGGSDVLGGGAGAGGYHGHPSTHHYKAGPKVKDPVRLPGDWNMGSSAPEAASNGVFLTEEDFSRSLEGHRPVSMARDRIPLDPNKPKPVFNAWSFVKSAIGKDLAKITLPAFFNEPLALLQRMGEDVEYAELLSIGAAVGTGSCTSVAAQGAERLGLDPEVLKTMKGEEASMLRLLFVSAYAMSNYSSTIARTGKPFNPVLGETWEFVNDEKQYRYVSEQVCHHPPVSACFAESADWVFWTEVNVKSKFWGTSLEIRPLGHCHVRMAVPSEENAVAGVTEHYSWKKVTTTVNNLIGKLTITHNGDMVIKNHRTGEECSLTFRPRQSSRQSSSSWFGWGGSNSTLDKDKSEESAASAVGEIVGTLKDRHGEAKWNLEGSWGDRLVATPVGGATQGTRSLPSSFPIWIRLPQDPLAPQLFHMTKFAQKLNELPDSLRPHLPPTDSRLRLDQRAMEEGRWDDANKEKETLEQVQRARRKVLMKEFESTGRPHGPDVGKEADSIAVGEPWWTPKWFVRKVEPDTGDGHWEFTGAYWRAREAGKWPDWVVRVFEPHDA
ncbi:hypothetical protein HK101_005981 [Irineochytrium annulatum]|nr:hypothetical protein HK101_005981 [Irineochytrium annulatum]